MFTIEQYLAKAAEYAKCAVTANSPTKLVTFISSNGASPSSRTMSNGLSTIKTRPCARDAMMNLIGQFWH